MSRTSRWSADRGKIRLILENLLSNAIKYSPKGGTIYLRARANGEQLVLEVADTGPGHPARGSRAHLRGLLYRPRRRRARASGTGIGLSVVNEFVNAHGGTIEIVDGEFPGRSFPHHACRSAPRAAIAPARRDRKAQAHAA